MITENGDFPVTKKNMFYSSLTILFAGAVLFVGLVAWFYIARLLWDIIRAALG